MKICNWFLFAAKKDKNYPVIFYPIKNFSAMNSVIKENVGETKRIQMEVRAIARISIFCC